MVVSASRIAAESLRVLPRKRLSRMMGRLSDLDGPPQLVQRAVDTFTRVYNVDMSEAAVPEGGYGSFDEFFTRELLPGSRPVATLEDTAVCPSDGRLLASGPIGAGATFPVKGRLYDAAELLGDAAEGPRFEGGTFAIIYLAPPDYHRVHAGVDGRVSSMRHVGGTLYPVNSIGMKHVPKLFAQNERVVVHQESEAHGHVATLLVGAIGVGRIGLTFEDVLTNTGSDPGVRRYGDGGPTLRRGDEIGMFHLGSTVIILFDSEHEILLRGGERARMGQPLARRGAP